MFDRKKILIIVPTLQVGGQEQMVDRTVEILKDHYDITVIVFDDHNQFFSPSCTVLNINVPAKQGKVKKIVNVLKRVQAVRKIKKEYQFDICISFGVVGGANLVNVLSRKSEKVILNIRAYKRSLASWSASWMFRKSNKVICCSHELKQTLTDQHPALKEKFVVINNAYNISQLIELAKEQVTDYEFCSPTIVFHGRVDAIKNLSRLLRAFALVRTEIPNVKLLIIGDGNFRIELERQIAMMNLSDCIDLIGFRKNPYAYLSRSSIFVLSSLSEGFPNSLVEALPFVPVVSVACKTGPREILCKAWADVPIRGVECCDYGILVPSVDNIDDHSGDLSMADGILMLLKNQSVMDQYKEKARERANDFSYERYFKAMNNMIEQL